MSLISTIKLGHIFLAGPSSSFMVITLAQETFVAKYEIYLSSERIFTWLGNLPIVIIS